MKASEFSSRQQSTFSFLVCMLSFFFSYSVDWMTQWSFLLCNWQRSCTFAFSSSTELHSVLFQFLFHWTSCFSATISRFYGNWNILIYWSPQENRIRAKYWEDVCFFAFICVQISWIFLFLFHNMLKPLFCLNACIVNTIITGLVFLIAHAKRRSFPSVWCLNHRLPLNDGILIA